MDKDVLAAVMRRLGVGSNLGLCEVWGTCFAPGTTPTQPENGIQEGWWETLQSRGICSRRRLQGENQGG